MKVTGHNKHCKITELLESKNTTLLHASALVTHTVSGVLLPKKRQWTASDCEEATEQRPSVTAAVLLFALLRAAFHERLFCFMGSLKYVSSSFAKMSL